MKIVSVAHVLEKERSELFLSHPDQHQDKEKIDSETSFPFLLFPLLRPRAK